MSVLFAFALAMLVMFALYQASTKVAAAVMSVAR